MQSNLNSESRKSNCCCCPLQKGLLVSIFSLSPNFFESSWIQKSFATLFGAIGFSLYLIFVVVVVVVAVVVVGVVVGVAINLHQQLLSLCHCVYNYYYYYFFIIIIIIIIIITFIMCSRLVLEMAIASFCPAGQIGTEDTVLLV